MIATAPVIASSANKGIITAKEIEASRVFGSPLLSVGRIPTAAENQAIGEVLAQYRERPALRTWDAYLQAQPQSPWRASLLVKLGQVARDSGALSRSIECWSEAWKLLKDQPEPGAQELGGRMAGDLAELLAMLGQQDALRVLLTETEARAQRFAPPTLTKLQMARQLLDRMEQDPEHTLICGPAALAYLGQSHPGSKIDLDALQTTTVGPRGSSLTQNWKLAESWGLGLQMAARKAEGGWPVPSIVHWKLGHFTAVVAKRDDLLLIKDVTLGGERWVRQEVLAQESTGYALIPAGQMPQGWRPVASSEGDRVWGGSCMAPAPQDQAMVPKHKTKECPVPPKPTPPGSGMPVAELDIFNSALLLNDIPVSYDPPRGPGVAFRLSYNSKNAYQGLNAVGLKWGFSWLLSLTDDATTVGQTVYVYPSEGGRYAETGYNSTTQTYAPNYYTHDQLVRTSGSSYKLIHPDGSVDIFDLTNGSTGTSRRIYRTKFIDPAGNTLTFGFDASLRLVTVKDALGQTTTLSYGLTSYPNLVTSVQDPFGRSAVLTYDSTGYLLTSITDAVGLTSTFSYSTTIALPKAQRLGQDVVSSSTGSTPPPADFIVQMTTPYGISTFTHSDGSLINWIEAKDPMGNRQRVEYQSQLSTILPGSDLVAPPGVLNSGLYYNNSFYWDKKAMALYPGDYTKAHIYKWQFNTPTTVGSTMRAEKKPLDSRIWYLYPNQALAADDGSDSLPTTVERMLDDQTVQATLYQYNAIGKPTLVTDPSGRITKNVYSADGIDLLEVHNITGGQDDLLATYTYNTQHKPLTAKDAAGQTTTFTYNSFGQVLSITNPKSEVTTLTYDANGYLQSIKSPVVNSTQAITAFTYDAVGRIRTLTSNPDAYTLTYDYDNLDRRTKVTYPDLTTEQMDYDRLDLWRTKDRLGRYTVMTYNALRQLSQVQDPQGRVTFLDYCGCGSLDGLTDSLGHTTTWIRDLQGRVTEKVYFDGTAMAYSYDGIGRLTKRQDAMGQITEYGYLPDNNLAAVSYTNAQKATPNVGYTYDLRYNRLLTMTDGSGTTTYAYNPVTGTPTLGAGRLASVTGPWANSAIAYTYDALGRVTTRGINGVNETRAFDALGRTFTVANPLGSFSYAYDGPTSRLATINLPNGQKTSFSYFATAGDKRLQQIQNLKSDNSSISTFAYTYDATGQIQSWSRQADAQTPTVYTYGYDAVGQILNATLKDSSNTVLKAYVYGYDEAGNRTTEQINGATTTSTYNNLNQLTGQTFSATPSLAPPSGQAQPLKVKPGSRSRSKTSSKNLFNAVQR